EGTEHLEMDIYVDSYEYFIIQRLEREKRSGTIEKIDEHCYRFSIDVYDAKEMIPWIRTFIGRIMRLECSNPKVTEKFYQDLQTVYELYGGNKDVV
ncbi:MAG: WYL domain-containing protein, partial [Ruminococcus sp.]|nr:WYL domain-containing protein [Ruminococcus sp.]